MATLLPLRRHDLDLVEHFVVLREPPNVALVPDLFALDVYVEDSARAFDQLGLDPKLLLDRLRQTGGSREVVSLSAVLDRDVHFNHSPVFRLLNAQFGMRKLRRAVHRLVRPLPSPTSDDAICDRVVYLRRARLCIRCIADGPKNCS